MGGVMILGSGLLFLVSLNEHENGEPFAQVEVAQLIFAALMLICGTAIYLLKGDN